MRILIVIHNLGSGGAQRAVTVLANHWAAQGHSVTIATMEGGETSPFHPLNPGVKVESLTAGLASRGLVQRMRFTLRKILFVRKTAAHGRADVVVSFTLLVNVLSLLALLGTRFPVVVSERVAPGQQLVLNRIWRIMRALLYPRAKGVVVQTERIAAHYRPFLGSRVVVIPNPVPVPHVEGTDERGLVGRKTVLSVGRLDHQKGFDLLIKAFARISPKHPDWELAIFGSGPDEESLKLLARNLGTARVRFPGRVQNPYALMMDAGLYVSASRFEGFPNALAEAMASGLPVVATDCPTGPRELITDGVNGLLVPNEDVEALARAMDRMMRDEELRHQLGENATSVIQTFGSEKILRLWEAALFEKGERGR